MYRQREDWKGSAHIDPSRIHPSNVTYNNWHFYIMKPINCSITVNIKTMFNMFWNITQIFAF